MTRIRIENVVASTALGDHLDLQRIADRLEGAEYEPSKFPGLIYRLKEAGTAVLLFQSGKVVCTGGKSRKQVQESIRTISAMIEKTGQKVLSKPKIDVQNIVATSDLGSEINLNSIAVTLGLDRVEYEPEQFPGLVVRLESPRVVILLFGSGKLVCTGGRSPKDVELGVEQITKELELAGQLGGRAASTHVTHAPPRRASAPSSAMHRTNAPSTASTAAAAGAAEIAPA